MQVTATIQKNVIANRSCVKCGHIKVCAVFRAIAPLLQNWKENERPFEPEDLATICKVFVSAGMLSALNGIQETSESAGA